MEATSSYHPRNEEHDAFSGIEPRGTRRKVDESSRLFDVFINHRGPDVKLTLALQLYNSLTKLGIRAFLDSEEKELGHSFPSTIENAIHSAKVHIAIFSRGYADSPWCLTELVLMLHSSAKIIPVFYGVKPSALRHLENGVYGRAFTLYEEKGRYMEKLKGWKEALHSVSLLTGHDISSNFNDLQNLVSAVQKEVERKKPLHVATHPVGLHRLVKDFEKARIYQPAKDFETRYETNEDGKEKTQIVGICGMGGVGKTTLAKELFNRLQSQYSQASFLFDVREADENNIFPSLQMKLLKDLFQKEGSNFQSTEEGKTHIADCIERSNQPRFLIVLDDIDHVQQLDNLLIMDILKKSVDSLALVTTRDDGVLRSIGSTVTYNLRGMDEDYARELFCWHAFGQPNPANGYENLVNSFLNVCGGLPLSLQVLGRHVRDRDQSYWSLELNKIRKSLPRDIHQRLKISFDALDNDEKQIFMDIACFFVDKLKNIAIEIWESSGLSAQHALKTLKSKCLVQEIEDALRMHDHLRDLGREMADRSSPRRVWRPRDLECLESRGFRQILAQTKGRCFHSFIDKSMNLQIRYFLGESEVSDDTTLLFWLEIEYAGLRNHPSIPSWIPLQDLRCLRIHNLCFKTFWHSPIQLGIFSWILSLLPRIGADARTDLSAISNCLEKLTLQNCSSLKTLQGLSGLKKLIELNISNCLDLLEVSVIDLCYLEELDISGCPSFKQLRLKGLNKLQSIKVEYSLQLERFELHDCRKLEKIPGILHLKKLVSIDIRGCPKLYNLSIEDCGILKIVAVVFDRGEFPEAQELLSLAQLSHLKTLNLFNCPELEELSCSALSSHLKRITVESCNKLRSITLPPKLDQLVIEGCRELKIVNLVCHHSERLELPGLPGVPLLSLLKWITIQRCDKLHIIQGIDELRALESLHLSDCPDLKELPCSARQTCLKIFSIVRCGKLQSIALPPNLVDLIIESCRQLKTVAVVCDHTEFLELQELSSVARLRCLKWITIQSCGKLQKIEGIDEFCTLESLLLSNCTEFEELPCSGLSNLKWVTIESCEKLKIITLPPKPVEVVIESCRELKTVALTCNHSESLELHELGVLRIGTCDKMQTIKGTNELQVLTMEILYSSSAAMQNCISKFKSMPSEFLVAIGRAADGVLLTLSPDLFSDADSIVPIVPESGTDPSDGQTLLMSGLHQIIFCYVVVVDGGNYLVEMINQTLAECSCSNYEVQQGEWVITIVITDPHKMSLHNRRLQLQDVLVKHGVLKLGYKVVLKNGNWWKTQRLLLKIIEKVYHASKCKLE